MIRVGSLRRREEEFLFYQWVSLIMSEMGMLDHWFAYRVTSCSWQRGDLESLFKTKGCIYIYTCIILNDPSNIGVAKFFLIGWTHSRVLTKNRGKQESTLILILILIYIIYLFEQVVLGKCLKSTVLISWQLWKWFSLINKLIYWNYFCSFSINFKLSNLIFNNFKNGSPRTVLNLLFKFNILFLECFFGGVGWSRFSTLFISNNTFGPNLSNW